jgi:hypothetical protein
MRAFYLQKGGFTPYEKVVASFVNESIGCELQKDHQIADMHM